jgi:hypothetical protein
MARNATTEEMSIPQAAAILRRHEGSITAIARKFGVRTASVSMVLSGHIASKRIQAAAIKKALALLEQERVQEGSAA